MKNFRFADPFFHKDLFILAEKYVSSLKDSLNQRKFNFLLKLFDKAEIINTNDD